MDKYKKKITIGIIDDHTLFTQSLSWMLESFDKYSVVISAINGIDLQRRLPALATLPEVVLVDVNMPEMGGIETADWLHKKYPSIKMIALSMNDKESAIIGMITAGCCAYLLKDTPVKDLETALDEVVEKGYYNADVSNTNFRRLLEHERNQIKLTNNEIRFLALACSDLTYKEIAAKMFLSERTIDGYRENLFIKLNVKSRVGMVIESARRDLVKIW
jgi:DNA-binding NarL/FixJ family response regulator